MSAVLITGGYGFLGSHVARRLINENRDVIILDSSDDDERLKDVAGNYRFVQCNLTDYGQLVSLFSKYRINEVCHLASMVGPCTEEDLFAAFENNVMGTMNLLELSRRHEVGCFFFGSSSGVYGRGDRESPVVDEDSPQFPRHMYGTTKVCCERLGEQYYRTYGLNFRGIRFSPIFGLTRRTRGPTAFCDDLLREVLKGNAYAVNVEADTPIVSAITVQDAAQAVANLMGADEAGLTRRIYSIDAFAFKAEDLVDEVKRQIPHAQIIFKPDPVISDSLRNWPVPSNQGAIEDWHWSPMHCDVSAYVTCVIKAYTEHKKKD